MITGVSAVRHNSALQLHRRQCRAVLLAIVTSCYKFLLIVCRCEFGPSSSSGINSFSCDIASDFC